MSDTWHHKLPDEFISQVTTTTYQAEWPLCSSVEQNVLIYQAQNIRQENRDSVKAEWCRALMHGPGVIAIKAAYKDNRTIDTATELFEQLIDHESADQSHHHSDADHFAKAGANNRIWNALQKHCMHDPVNYASYYSNDIIAIACEAWLGDGYQLTAQVNRVNPGGDAQTPHRDYHLGFMSADRMAKFPQHIHSLSPLLTLQGAIAHCDMPLATGPTLYLPYSQQFNKGYVEYENAEFQKYFAENRSQLPLAKGDIVFFNPAVMHGAGANQTNNTYRLANLLQASSVFGQAMESIDRSAMLKKVYPVLRNLTKTQQQVVIAATARGYAFPTNLDTDPPHGGMSPQTQSDLVHKAIEHNLTLNDFAMQLDAMSQKQLASPKSAYFEQ